MSGSDISRGKFRKVGTILTSIGAISGMVYGNLIALKILDQPLFEFSKSVSGQFEIGIGLIPPIILMILGLLLL
jgi:hypothetical protein